MLTKTFRTTNNDHPVYQVPCRKFFYKIVHVLGRNMESSNSSSSRILIIHQNHSRRLIRCIKVCIGNNVVLLRKEENKRVRIFYSLFIQGQRFNFKRFGFSYTSYAILDTQYSINPISYGLFNKPKVMGGADLPP